MKMRTLNLLMAVALTAGTGCAGESPIKLMIPRKNATVSVRTEGQLRCLREPPFSG